MRSILLPARRRSPRLPLRAFLLLGVLTSRMLGNSDLQAQSSANARSALWVAPVVGVASMGWLGGVDASLYNELGLFRLRYTMQGGATRDVTPDDAPTALQEVALMMGTGRLLDARQNMAPSNRGQWWSSAAGLAFVNTTYGKPRPSKNTLGVAAEAQVIIPRSPNVSITVLGNLNGNNPFVGLSLGLPFGRMPWSQPPQPPRRRPGPLY